MKKQVEADAAAWYERWFNDRYVAVYSHRDDAEARRQADLVADLFPPERYRRLLDLCCGEGRYARLFAAKGYAVTGVDLSRRLIEIARDRAGAGTGITYLVEDMRRIDFREEFDIVVNLFTSFGYFASEQEDRRVIRGVHRALRPRGVFWLDFLNRPFVLSRLKSTVKKAGKDTVVEESRRLSGDGKRVEKDILIREREGEGRESIHAYRESVRLYTREELHRMLGEAGFRVKREFGDYGGAPWSADRPRLIIAAEKRK